MLRLTQPTNFETLHSNLHVLKGGRRVETTRRIKGSRSVPRKSGKGR